MGQELGRSPQGLLVKTVLYQPIDSDGHGFLHGRLGHDPYLAFSDSPFSIF
jgi:hypothetical protein